MIVFIHTLLSCLVYGFAVIFNNSFNRVLLMFVVLSNMMIGFFSFKFTLVSMVLNLLADIVILITIAVGGNFIGFNFKNNFRIKS